MQIRKTQERVKLEENNYGSAALIYIFISFILCTMTLLMECSNWTCYDLDLVAC